MKILGAKSFVVNIFLSYLQMCFTITKCCKCFDDEGQSFFYILCQHYEQSQISNTNIRVRAFYVQDIIMCSLAKCMLLFFLAWKKGLVWIL